VPENVGPTKVHPGKLGRYLGLSYTVRYQLVISSRILRLLATNHMVTEVSPDVFANNRLSSVFDTEKSVEELLTRSVSSKDINSRELTTISPESKHMETLGIASLIEQMYSTSCLPSSQRDFRVRSAAVLALADPAKSSIMLTDCCALPA